MKILLALVVCLQTLQFSEETVTAKYSCYNPEKYSFGDESIFFTLIDSEGVYSRIFLDSSRNDECFVSSPDPLTLELKVDDEPKPNAHDCRVTLPHNNFVKARIIATKLVDKIDTSDLVFPITCDFNDNSTHVITSKPFPIIGEIPQGVSQRVTEDVKLVVTDLFGNPIDEVNIGQDVKLRVTLKKSETAKRVHALKCWAGDTSKDFYHFLEESCAVRDVPLESLSDKSPFGYGVSGLDTSDVFYSRDIQKFRIFLFNTESKLVTFGCEVEFCRDETDKRCAKNTCGAGPRVKRQTGETKTAGAQVTVLSKRQIENNAKIAAFTKNRNGKTCDGAWDEWLMILLIVLLSFLIVLFIVVTILICCCCVVDRDRGSPRGSVRSYPSRKVNGREERFDSYGGRNNPYPRDLQYDYRAERPSPYGRY